MEQGEPLYDNYIKPIGDYTGIGPYVGEVAEFLDPTPTIYEMTTGKDWDTGETERLRSLC